MRKCFCGQRASYFCRPCLTAICKYDKMVHETSNIQEHIYEKLGKKLSAQQFEKLVENISANIKILIEYTSKIFKESESIIAKISNMSMQALKIINEKHQNYAKLLRLCQKRLANDEIKEIQRQSSMFLMIKMPNYELDKIDNFCASNFLKELELAKEISSMPISNAKDFL